MNRHNGDVLAEEQVTANGKEQVPTVLSELRKWLHEQLERLPLMMFPFKSTEVPENGIYFFDERGEYWGHGGPRPRVVRVGTHRDGNFQTRIAEHYLLNERKMNFAKDQSAPHDRSIFRKNIGRCLLNMKGDPYLSIWELDFMKRAVCEAHRDSRNIAKEVEIETEVTRVLREQFSFRCIEVAKEIHRMGSEGLERALIGKLSHCAECQPSSRWLGKYSPKQKICNSGLWLVQHLKASPLTPDQQAKVSATIEKRIPHS